MDRLLLLGALITGLVGCAGHAGDEPSETADALMACESPLPEDSAPGLLGDDSAYTWECLCNYGPVGSGQHFGVRQPCDSTLEPDPRIAPEYRAAGETQAMVKAAEGICSEKLGQLCRCAATACHRFAASECECSEP